MRSLIVFFILFSSLISASSNVSVEADFIVQFNKIERPTDNQQRQLYNDLGKSVGLLEKKFSRPLLVAIINVYSKLFVVNLAHFHLEPFVPYYLKNKAVVDEVLKATLPRASQDEFYFRLQLAIGEHLRGNG
ncbi:MAG: hypothetical protein A2504_12690 [Bdellovibrionales bacterium RIFOXYD12_FULL_39_22]|nr:MAG: hypothetical protein A2385_03775 [Bdellovibrionales bacterium RIFOXYB1_FULL_39_21]OFZ40471.1 MAG: hypothetical protein A2485_02640 [Bdellovibrionales bacterium RIFOXYC12_FULL_39_17]OFZ49954.1 MAG: hypothetical protein A2404_01975 [Bdellovibrionales bacterium RIFOXYC1_FULL_39_130]OFZ77596.1 MAG: hypothetical protein A2560_04535 [Bdellovibrionales bacterium RIFOXYD1_FULL_39_84]OFZ96050.1 MAG: hypothetical protein A2504_12690 [Bdellovibrionales bacterium RIFOXYD12_FULL_39_22]HLE10661.1 hy